MRKKEDKIFLIYEDAGFTLIELMATVAIVGVLAAIAIPNYTKYQRKARQAEAKSALGSIYVAERTIFNSEDGRTFSSCVGALGYAPEGINLYAVGFTDVAARGGTCMPNGAPLGAGAPNCLAYSYKAGVGGAYTSVSGCTTAEVGATYFLSKKSEVGGAPVPTEADLGGTLTWNTFEIVASGAIGGTAIDRWAVDQNKQVYPLQDGVE